MAAAGAGSLFAYIPELTYGTQRSPTYAIPYLGSTIQAARPALESGTVHRSNPGLDQDQTRFDIVAPRGTVSTPLWTRGLEPLFRSMMGDYVYAAGVHTFKAGLASAAPSLTAAMSLGHVDLAPSWLWYSGMVIESWQLDFRPIEPPLLTFASVCQDELATDVAPSSYVVDTSARLFTGADMTTVATMTLNGHECVTAIVLSGRRFFDARRGHGTATWRDPRIEPVKATYTATITVDWEQLNATPGWYQNHHAIEPLFYDLVLELYEPSGVGSRFKAFGSIRVDGNTPNVNGLGVIQVDIPCRFMAGYPSLGSPALTFEIENGTPSL